MRIRAQDSALADAGFLQNAAGTNQDACGYFRSVKYRVEANGAGRANTGSAENLHEGFDHRIRADFNIVIDHACGGIEDGDALSHQVMALAHAHLVVDERKLHTRIGAENFGGVFRFPDDDALPRLTQNLGHVREVVLAVRVGGRDFLNVREQLRNGKDVEAGIDFVDLFLCWAGRFFLDDGLDLGAASAFAQDAAVAGGVFEVGAEQSHRGLFVEMEVEQAGDGLRHNLRGVSGEDDHVIVFRERRLRDHKSVTGAALLGLQDEIDASRSNGAADT